MIKSLIGTAIAASQMVPPASPPLKLITEASGDHVQLKVLGSSAKAMEARYALEVLSHSKGGTSKSVQSGEVSLRPGVPVTVLSLNIGGKDVEWNATLNVQPKGEAEYQQVKTSKAP